MFPTLTFNELATTLIVPVSQPQEFRLDSLYQRGIVDRSWSIIEPPLYAYGQIQLKFAQGTISVEPNRIGLIHQQSDIDAAKSWSLASARRCIACFPNFAYEGIGFCLTGILRVSEPHTQPEALLRQTLLPVGQWHSIEQIDPCVVLKLVYPLPGRELALLVAEGGIKEQDTMQPTINLRATLMYTVSEVESAHRVAALNTALDRYIEDVKLCKSLIKHYCQQILGTQPRVATRSRRRIRVVRSIIAAQP
ncbi:hypothetical protein IQ250_01745 [Pseudanabaenaceae cyanobacterium LEGE 13415]|nr:hypothetical protein [Pseudanabaenaceae cyanobacterium LEGE 13415]